jgi:hypothetical protein
MDFRFRLTLVLVLASPLPAVTNACPFCSAVSQTFSEEMESMDVVALAELVTSPNVASLQSGDPDAELPKSRFRIVSTLKGDRWAEVGQLVETLYFGEPRQDRAYLMMAADAPHLSWSTPLVLSARAADYLRQLPDLPRPDPAAATEDRENTRIWAQRLVFFQDFLEDQDEMLARDAYDEFAKAPYEAVIAMREQMKRPQLVEWINDSQVPSNRRRLYFTMLGVCGSDQDLDLLESLMKSDQRQQKAGLDALVACYLILKGEAGLPLVEDLFLKDQEADYADTYAVIMALRFHGSQVSVIPRSRLVKSLRLMLDRPDLADLVIPDLARWEDWDVMPRLVQLFQDADQDSSWVRVPVINYLRACPLPEASRHIDELSKIDPESVKRAQTYFPIDAENGGESSAEQPDDAPAATSGPADGPPKTSRHPRTSDPRRHMPERGSGASAFAVAGLPTSGPRAGARPATLYARLPFRFAEAGRDRERVADAADAPATLSQVELLATKSGPNRWLILGIVAAVGLSLVAVMRAVLGFGCRSTRPTG